MRKLLLIGIPLAILFFAASATNTYAQDTPKAEIFTGYSYMHDDIGDGSLNMNGFEVSGAGNINKWLGIEGDVSAHFNSSHDHVSYMAGPRFAFRNGRFTPYVHALFGGDTAVGFGDSSAFAMAIGGGVDAKINDNISIRIVQVDYHPLFYDSVAQNVRVSTGVVFTFGKK